MKTNHVYLFTYGTLGKNHYNPMAAFLRRNSVYKGEGYIFGRKIQVSWYPGVIQTNNSKHRVKGEVYQLFNPGSVFKVIDKYEGIYPEGEYTRKVATCYLVGQVLNCWVYFYVKRVF